MSHERGEAMDRTQDRADEDRAAAEALAAALRALLESLPRCDFGSCGRIGTRLVGFGQRCGDHAIRDSADRRDPNPAQIEQAQAAIAAWEARGR